MTPQGTAGLTKKQKLVYDLLDEGMRPPDIAKRMKVTPAAVHSHIRQMRRQGIVPPNEQVNGGGGDEGGGAEPPPAPPAEREPVLALNGDPEASLRAAIADGATRASEIDQEVESLQQQVAALNAEREQLTTRTQKYQTALEALV